VDEQIRDLDLEAAMSDTTEPPASRSESAAGLDALDAIEPLEPLVPPNPVPVVAPAQASAMVPLDPATTGRLDAKVGAFVDSAVGLDVHSEGFRQKAEAISGMGATDIRASANVSNRLLERPVTAIQKGPFASRSNVSTSLIHLRRTVEDLDPSKQGALGPRRLLGILPMGDRLRDYFSRYQSAQTHLNAIIQSLYGGQDELRKDNASIEAEKQNLWTVMQRLEQYAYLGRKLDAALVGRIATLQATDPARAKVISEELLFPVRQKVQDLLTQLAVSVQGYLALDLIRKNNVELIKGVDRATTTTVSALRTAVIVARALSDQKLVLDQIQALNTTTGSIIESTSAMLREQSTRVNEQAVSSTVSLEKLQAAFDNIYATMDAIDEFKVKALGTMQETVDALTTGIDSSRAYLDRVRSEQATSVGAGESGEGGAAAGGDAAAELTI
jgi:uncharacterized protein YaaN involved in tellurite resistance